MNKTETWSLSGVLHEEVKVFRDEIGVSHIRAANRHDAFVMQGFVHAQDRLWQMDAARMLILGRWSEWVGESGVMADILVRRLGGERTSRRDYEALAEPTKQMLEDYSAGVNAYLDAAEKLPVEYEITGQKPEPWQPWHSVGVMRQRGYLMGSVWFKLWRAAAVGLVPDDVIAELRYDDGDGDRLIFPAGVDAKRFQATLEMLRPSIAALAALGSAEMTGGGSNNWAISGEKTSSGLPILAGDPHRSYEMPAMYVQQHLASDEFDAIGFTVPGVPAFPHFAHNGKVAWSVTHAFADIHDLYVDRFELGSANRYLMCGEWQEVKRWSEIIKVKGAADREILVTETAHGPVVAGDPASGYALTLKSAQFFDTDISLDALLPQLLSSDVEEFYEASRDRWGVIDHNLVAVDSLGNIGHRVRAKVPKRNRLNGWLPMPGWTGKHEWQGYIEFDHMPSTINPPSGIVVTANNRVTDCIQATGDYFCTDAHPPFRARRIEQLLAAKTTFTPNDMAVIHRDVLSEAAQQVQSTLAMLKLEAGTPAAEIRDEIVSWDGRMSADSVAASRYSQFRWQLAATLVARSGLDRVREHPFQRVLEPLIPENHMWWMIPTLLREKSEWPLGGTDWEQVLVEVLSVVAEEPEALWGELHTVRMQHLLNRAYPESIEMLSPEGPQVAGDNECVFANGSVWQGGLHNVYGAVARYVFVPGDWDSSTWVSMSGVSGDPLSENYLLQQRAWADGELYPMHYSWDLVMQSACEKTVIKPT